MTQETPNPSKKEFWNSRSELKKNPGTDDFILKELELKTIAKHIKDGSSVFDIGCGNGQTLIHLVKNKKCHGTGLDFSEGMISAAQQLAEQEQCSDQVTFQPHQLPGLGDSFGVFDYTMTERCLINLDNPQQQQQTFYEIMSTVKPGGKYLMIENSLQSLNNINEVRKSLDLEEIAPPWHNVYLDDDFVKSWENESYMLSTIDPFASTYYFMSRAVYAKLAADANEELKYDSKINLLSRQLPIMGDFGPTKLWIWEHRGK